MVDIRGPLAAVVPAQLAVDTNVLYAIHYGQEFCEQAPTAGEQPLDYQARAYGRLYKYLLSQPGKFKIFTTAVNLYELVRLVEEQELTVEWVLAGERSHAFGFKDARRRFAPKLPNIHRKAAGVMSAVLKYAALLPGVELEVALAEWQGSAADIADAHLVASARAAGVLTLVSDDSDFTSFGGITMLTANGSAIAGK